MTSLLQAFTNPRPARPVSDRPGHGFRVEALEDRILLSATLGADFASLDPDSAAAADTATSSAALMVAPTVTASADTSSSGSGSSGGDGSDDGETEQSGPYSRTIQAEEAVLSGAAVTGGSVTGASGGAYVELAATRAFGPFGALFGGGDGAMPADPAAVSFDVEVPEDGWYTLEFRYANGSDTTAVRNLLIDGQDLEGTLGFTNQYAQDVWATAYDRVPLSAGSHTITLTSDMLDEAGASSGAGTLLVDSLTVAEGVRPSQDTSARSLLMNNWENMVAIHESAILYPDDTEAYGPFLSQLRHGANWSQDQIDFATLYLQDVTDPDQSRNLGPYFDSDLFFDEDGIMNVEYGNYLPTGEALPVSIEKEYAMVPEQELLVERYTLTNEQQVGTGLVTWNVMNLLKLNDGQMQDVYFDEQLETFVARLEQGNGAEPLFLAFGSYREMDGQQIGTDLGSPRDITQLPGVGDDAAPAPSDGNPIEQFRATGSLTGTDAAGVVSGEGLGLAFEDTVELYPTRPLELYFYYTLSDSYEGLVENVETALNPIEDPRFDSPQFWFERTAAEWSTKLSKALEIPVDGNAAGGGADDGGGSSSSGSSGAAPGSGAGMDGGAGSDPTGGDASLDAVDDPALAEAYRKSLVTILQSQQPEYGSFVAATNPAYDFKVWPRDSSVTAIGLDAAGFFDEAEAYWKWMASVEEDGDGPQGDLFENGTFYTNYSYWDENEPIDFVQPEWDAQGLFLIGVYKHYTQLMEAGRSEQAEAFVNDETIRGAFIDSANFIAENIDETGFGPPEFSIWETFFAYNAFTQVTYASGLNAAWLLADEIGASDQAQDWLDGAQTIKNSILRPTTADNPGLWNEEDGYFVWGITPEGRVIERPNAAADLIWVFDLIDAGDPKAQSQMDYILDNLSKNTYGIARYNSDNFYYSSPFSPGGAYESQVEETSWPQMTSYMGMGMEYTGDDDWALNSLKWTVSRYGVGFMPPGEGVDWSTREPLPSTMVEPVTGAWYILNLLNYTDQYDPRLPDLPEDDGMMVADGEEGGGIDDEEAAAGGSGAPGSGGGSGLAMLLDEAAPMATA